MKEGTIEVSIRDQNIVAGWTQAHHDWLRRTCVYAKSYSCRLNVVWRDRRQEPVKK